VEGKEVEFNNKNIINVKEEAETKESEVKEGFLSDELVLAQYFEHQSQHNFVNDGNNQRNQDILYYFLDHIWRTDY